MRIVILWSSIEAFGHQFPPLNKVFSTLKKPANSLSKTPYEYMSGVTVAKTTTESDPHRALIQFSPKRIVVSETGRCLVNGGDRAGQCRVVEIEGSCQKC